MMERSNVLATAAEQHIRPSGFEERYSYSERYEIANETHYGVIEQSPDGAWRFHVRAKSSTLGVLATTVEGRAESGPEAMRLVMAILPVMCLDGAPPKSSEET